MSFPTTLMELEVIRLSVVSQEHSLIHIWSLKKKQAISKKLRNIIMISKAREEGWKGGVK